MSIGLGAILLMAAGTYALRFAGLSLAGGLRGSRTARLLAVLPAALLASILVPAAFGGGGGLVVDARAVGVLTAVVIAWRGGSMPLVVAGGMGATALVRLAGLAT